MSIGLTDLLAAGRSTRAMSTDSMDTHATGFGLRRCVFVAILTTTADCLVWGFSGFDQATEADGFTHAKQRPSSGQTCDLRMRVTQRRLTLEVTG